MRTLFEDFSVPLPEVSRAWIRRPAFILLLPLFLLAFVIGSIGTFVDFIIELFTEIW